MITSEKRKLIAMHRNYRIVFLDEEQLMKELKSWTREDLISWLKWNDPNGIYNDQESLNELGAIMTYDEGVELLVKQILQA